MEVKDFMIIILIIGIIVVFLYKDEQNKEISEKITTLITQKEQLQNKVDNYNKVEVQNKLYLNTINKQKENIKNIDKEYFIKIKEREEAINLLDIQVEQLEKQIMILLKESEEPKELTMAEKRKNYVEQRKKEHEQKEKDRFERIMKQKQDAINHQRKLEFEIVRKPTIIHKR